MLLGDQFFPELVDLTNHVLVVLQVLLKFIELLLKNFYVFEVVTIVVGRHKSLFLRNPEHQLVALTSELDETHCLLQLQAFLLETLEQEIPETVKFD